MIIFGGQGKRGEKYLSLEIRKLDCVVKAGFQIYVGTKINERYNNISNKFLKYVLKKIVGRLAFLLKETSNC